ncbi:MraZ protein [Verrucomicrobium sp. GAS474]|uniref:division/cell wall cluster transcriptional repressor MraZ n=1 Tax=Verrucomicrobium sp. GAS474 TaxID=1882831 RepID=UPI00087A1B88|nr:division/cell wall cluster transcriptional repressor MraZ [Verrucomicrobium sp. GAS474]SDU28922.1 MraZ protein [Verrucomicrobium sp. GAS474]
MQPDLRASYTDTFEHAFDEKGRITIPSEWRGGAYEVRLFVLPAKDGCIKVYPESWLGRLQAGMKELEPAQREQVRQLVGTVQAALIDAQGRILLKEKFRKPAGIEREAVLVGRLDHFAIYNPAALRAITPQTTTLEDVADALGI